ncbi:MAG TPA: isoamylase, partial [Bryobacteraceae bacterium]
EGCPHPLGAVWIENERAFNFAIYSKAASAVRLLFFTPHDCVSSIFTYEFDPLRNKTGPVWHARVALDRIPNAVYYAYSIDGPGVEFRPQKLLLDPYAKEIAFPPAFDRTAAFGNDSNAGKAPLSLLPVTGSGFDWEDDCSPRHDGDLIVYELHVRGFTMNSNSGIEPPRRGTFQGVVEKIPYLRELGITAVELMPIFEFDPTEPNYWGYMPLNFFAPHHTYAADRSVKEFKSMVKALHRAGIEVILDVVYNHTGEGDELGPTFGFKGIDCWTYYMGSGDTARPYADFSGTGNTLNCANRAVRQLIVDSLRYWAREMHVDGFRFDLASVFSRNPDGSIDFDDPPIFGDIGSDPDLQNLRLIAEPWEGNLKYPNYELGEGRAKPHFPGTSWRQWNDRFRSAVRHFIKSDSGALAEFIMRLYGSSDFFPDSLPESSRPYQSLNYVDCHDGFTLYDLVAYTTLDSWNCGQVDGDAGIDDAIMSLRKRQVKNFFCVLMLANGTPMFRAGDEFLQTQYGNGNPYNVDGPLTWLDWNRLEAHRDVFRFFSKMIAFRKGHPSIGRSTFWRDDVHWYGVGRDVDLSGTSHAFAFCLQGSSVGDKDIYVLFNAYWEPLEFEIQEGDGWIRIADTFLESPNDFTEAPEPATVFVGGFYTAQPRSVVIFVSK